VLGLNPESVAQITTSFQGLVEVLNQLKSGEIGGVSESIGKVVSAIEGLSDKPLGIDTAAFSEVTSSLENMLHLMEQVYGVYSQDTISTQWDTVKSKFEAASEAETADIETQKKALQELEAEYQKYVNMGGTREYKELFPT
jgi:hypothetical protein